MHVPELRSSLFKVFDDFMTHEYLPIFVNNQRKLDLSSVDAVMNANLVETEAFKMAKKIAH